MKLLDILDEIDASQKDVYVVHEKFERNYEMHSHVRDQLSYVEGGIAYVEIENEYFVVPAMHFLWIPANTKHHLKVSHHATQLHSYYFKSSDKEFYRNLKIYPASKLVTELIKFSERWKHQFVNFSEPHANALSTLHDLLQLSAENPIKLQLPTTENPRMEDIISYIQQKFNKAIRLEELCDRFNVSERTFCRLFKKEMNISFSHYLKTYRIIQAIDYLQKRKDHSVEEIANACGYESISAFSNAFLELTGMRPSQMRKSIG
ncbi:AraC family transcriptional regulator [Epilithonimonas sp.]|uniref:AraC family transcriptional regulator n=1 Tax=Epilithonimonas sp. TaxID=2894511 RepID=UPI002FDD3ACB